MNKMEHGIPEEIRQRASRVKLIAFDVDGVLTDGRLFLGDDGDEYKAFNSKDGQGLVMLLKAGFELAIITGRTSNIVANRMQALGIKYIYQGCSDKLPVFEKLLQETRHEADQTAYVGDDLPDLPVIKRAGLGITVADGHRFVCEHADWTTSASGGMGAVREITDLLLDSQGLLDKFHQQALTG